MSGHVIERLSAYIDGELEVAERDRVRGHLSSCAGCAAVLADLEGVVRAARALDDRPPAKDLWPGIASRLEPRTGPAVIPIGGVRGRRRFSFTVPQLAAAAVALVVISSAVVWLAGPGPSGIAVDGQETRPGTLVNGPQGIPVAYEETPAYADALADLTAAFEANRDRLDPATVAAVERNLAIIDEAIRQTVEALEADPGSTFLYDHLERSRRQKLDVLQQATLTLPTT